MQLKLDLLLEKFVEHTISLMSFSSDLDEVDYDLEAQILANFKAIQGIKE